MTDDDDLARYQPPVPRRPREVVEVDASEAGIVATVRMDGQREDPRPNHTSGARDMAAHQPTRYSESLRRQAANRARRRAGLQPLPALTAGDCVPCDGWGVRGPRRERCPHCNGRGIGA